MAPAPCSPSSRNGLPGHGPARPRVAGQFPKLIVAGLLASAGAAHGQAHAHIEPTAPGWYYRQPLPDGAPASNPILLTDGTVMLHEFCTPTWYRLTPDQYSNYFYGTWTQAAPMVANKQAFAPGFFSSTVLPDGRMIVAGGEYTNTGNGCVRQDSNTIVIYDPVANSWTTVPPPAGWQGINDASGTLLADGTFMLANASTKQAALLDPVTLTWRATGVGKFDINAEENWTLLPNGDVLAVDAYIGDGGCGTATETFSGGRWRNAGDVVAELAGCDGDIPTFEAPTQILHPSGKVYAFGATASEFSQNYAVYTGIYDTATGTWSAGPNMPNVGGVNYTMADAPAAVLPSGNILIAASPGIAETAPFPYPPPTHFFEFDGTSFTQVADLADSADFASDAINFLVLPTGHILTTETFDPDIELYVGAGTANPSWAPAISKLSSTLLIPGFTYTATGTQFSGLTYGAVYGNDVQAATNFPLVQITNVATQHVFYARTTNFTSVSVAPGTAASTQFTVPTANIETGPSTLVVIANGIASTPVNVTVAYPHLTIKPAACVQFPWTGGQQKYTVILTNKPPGLTLQYGFELAYGNSAADYISLIDPGATKITTDNPPLYVGSSKSATITVAQLPGSGASAANSIEATLWSLGKDGKTLQPVTISPANVAASFVAGAQSCGAVAP
jgi:hypothetical protein